MLDIDFISHTLIHRPPRRYFPPFPPRPQQIAAPPCQRESEAGGGAAVAVIAAAVGVVLMTMMNIHPVAVAVGAVVLLVVFLRLNGNSADDERLERREREQYLNYLYSEHTKLQLLHERVRSAALRSQPDPHQLDDIMDDPYRLWERRRGDPDFLHARVGIGSVPWFGLTIPHNPDPSHPYDPIMAREALSLIESDHAISLMPAGISLRHTPIIALVGPAEHTVPLVRAMVAGLAVTHSPADMQLAVAIGPENLPALAGIDQLPHMRMSIHGYPEGPCRIAPDVPELYALLRGELDQRSQESAPPLVAIIDNTTGEHDLSELPWVSSTHSLGITTLALVADELQEPAGTTARLTVSQSGQSVLIEFPGNPAKPSLIVQPDQLSSEQFTDIATRLSPLRMAADTLDDTLSLHGVGRSPILWVHRNGHRDVVGRGVFAMPPYNTVRHSLGGLFDKVQRRRPSGGTGHRSRYTKVRIDRLRDI